MSTDCLLKENKNIETENDKEASTIEIEIKIGRKHSGCDRTHQRVLHKNFLAIENYKNI